MSANMPQDPFLDPSDEFVQNPFDTYAALRQTAPIWFSSVSNQWIITGYSEASAILRNPLILSSLMSPAYENEIAEAKPLRQAQLNWISMLNEPDHSRIRKPFFDAYSVASAQALQSYISSEVDELLEILSASDNFDGLYNYAAPLTTALLAHWFDVPAEDEVEFRRAAHFTASHFSPLRPGFVRPSFVASEKLLGLLDKMMRARMTGGENIDTSVANTTTDSPGEKQKVDAGRDLVSMMLTHVGQGVSQTEIRDNMLLTIFASYETVIHLISNGIYALLNNPSQLLLLRQEPTRISDVLDEILRFAGPVQMLVRTVKADFIVEDNQFKAGDRLTIVLAAANRDPREFDAPEEFRIDRTNKKHLAFGQGPHYCVGNHLAKLQAQAAIAGIFKKFPDLYLSSTPKYHPSIGIRGLLALPLSTRN